MPDIKIRKLPGWVLDSYRSRAQTLGHSLEQELRNVLTESAISSQLQFAEQAELFREAVRSESGVLTDSTPAIVEDRWKRG